jgi:class 3 adenylate cyclase
MPRSLGPDTILRRGAIVIVDQDGFTRKMLAEGAQAALRDVWLIRRVLIPIFRSEGGEVYKVDADNLYIYFEDVHAAVRASGSAHEALAVATRRRRSPVQVSIGIGFGELYYVTSEDDYYGREVNLASKLGEDVAEGGETLLTESAFHSVRAAELPGRPVRHRVVIVSDVKIRFHPWRY